MLQIYTKRKQTRFNTEYLLPCSCHPKQTFKAIPFSLALRIVRVCSKGVDKDKRLHELTERLLARNYNINMVESALNKVRSIPRAKALQKVRKKAQRERPVLAIHYDPSSIARHWRTITSKDSHLNKVFKEPPLTAYRRQ